MITITFEAPSVEALRSDLLKLLGKIDTPCASQTREFKATPLFEAPPMDEALQVTLEPVMSKPVEEPQPMPEVKQPTLEEVRAALKELRDRKGAGAVRELLKAYGADNLTELKPEDYMGALARAKTEV
jgi:hypothetical protein